MCVSIRKTSPSVFFFLNIYCIVIVTEYMKYEGLRIRIHLIRIRIQHFRLNTDPDPDPIRNRALITKN
jgi:hypothetical protein